VLYVLFFSNVIVFTVLDLHGHSDPQSTYFGKYQHSGVKNKTMSIPGALLLSGIFGRVGW